MDFLLGSVGEYLVDAIVLLALLSVSFGLSVVARRVIRGQLIKIAPGVAGFFATLVQLGIILGGVILAVYVAGVSGAVLLTVVAILSAGVSLALDHSAQDAIAGVKILVFGYVKAGDHVRLLDSYEGEVVATDLFTVTLRTRERDAVIIPNRNVIGSVVVNKSMIRGQAVDVMVPLRRPYDRGLGVEIMERAAAKIDDEHGDHVFDPEVRLVAVNGVEQWRIRVYVSDEMSLSRSKHILLCEVVRSLDEAGIVIGDFTEVMLLSEGGGLFLGSGDRSVAGEPLKSEFVFPVTKVDA